MAPSLEESACSAIQRRLLAWSQREALASLEKFQALDNSRQYSLTKEQMERLLADSWLSPIGSGGPLILPDERAAILPASLVVESPEQPVSSQPAAAVSVEPTDAAPDGNGAEQRLTALAVAVKTPAAPPEAAKPSWKIHHRLSRQRRLRPSDHCFLDIPWPEYLQLLHWAVARLRDQQTSRAPPDYFHKQQMDPDQWYQAFEHFEAWFGPAVGRAKSVAEVLQRSGRRWLHGLRRCRATFS